MSAAGVSMDGTGYYVHQEGGNDETLSVSCDKTRKPPDDNA